MEQPLSPRKFIERFHLPQLVRISSLELACDSNESSSACDDNDHDDDHDRDKCNGSKCDRNTCKQQAAFASTAAALIEDDEQKKKIKKHERKSCSISTNSFKSLNYSSNNSNSNSNNDGPQHELRARAGRNISKSFLALASSTNGPSRQQSLDKRDAGWTYAPGHSGRLDDSGSKSLHLLPSDQLDDDDDEEQQQQQQQQHCMSLGSNINQGGASLRLLPRVKLHESSSGGGGGGVNLVNQQQQQQQQQRASLNYEHGKLSCSSQVDGNTKKEKTTTTTTTTSFKTSLSVASKQQGRQVAIKMMPPSRRPFLNKLQLEQPFLLYKAYRKLEICAYAIDLNNELNDKSGDPIYFPHNYQGWFSISVPNEYNNCSQLNSSQHVNRQSLTKRHRYLETIDQVCQSNCKLFLTRDELIGYQLPAKLSHLTKLKNHQLLAVPLAINLNSKKGAGGGQKQAGTGQLNGADSQQKQQQQHKSKQTNSGISDLKQTVIGAGQVLQICGIYEDILPLIEKNNKRATASNNKNQHHHHHHQQQQLQQQQQHQQQLIDAHQLRNQINYYQPLVNSRHQAAVPPLIYHQQQQHAFVVQQPPQPPPPLPQANRHFLPAMSQQQLQHQQQTILYGEQQQQYFYPSQATGVDGSVQSRKAQRLRLLHDQQQQLQQQQNLNSTYGAAFVMPPPPPQLQLIYTSQGNRTANLNELEAAQMIHATGKQQQQRHHSSTSGQRYARCVLVSESTLDKLTGCASSSQRQQQQPQFGSNLSAQNKTKHLSNNKAAEQRLQANCATAAGSEQKQQNYREEEEGEREEEEGQDEEEEEIEVLIPLNQAGRFYLCATSQTLANEWLHGCQDCNLNATGSQMLLPPAPRGHQHHHQYPPAAGNFCSNSHQLVFRLSQIVYLLNLNKRLSAAKSNLQQQQQRDQLRSDGCHRPVMMSSTSSQSHWRPFSSMFALPLQVQLAIGPRPANYSPSMFGPSSTLDSYFSVESNVGGHALDCKFNKSYQRQQSQSLATTATTTTTTASTTTKSNLTSAQAPPTNAPVCSCPEKLQVSLSGKCRQLPTGSDKKKAASNGTSSSSSSSSSTALHDGHDDDSANSALGWFSATLRLESVTKRDVLLACTIVHDPLIHLDTLNRELAFIQASLAGSGNRKHNLNKSSLRLDELVLMSDLSAPLSSGGYTHMGSNSKPINGPKSSSSSSFSRLRACRSLISLNGRKKKNRPNIPSSMLLITKENDDNNSTNSDGQQFKSNDLALLSQFNLKPLGGATGKKGDDNRLDSDQLAALASNSLAAPSFKRQQYNWALVASTAIASAAAATNSEQRKQSSAITNNQKIVLIEFDCNDSELKFARTFVEHSLPSSSIPDLVLKRMSYCKLSSNTWERQLKLSNATLSRDFDAYTSQLTQLISFAARRDHQQLRAEQAQAPAPAPAPAEATPTTRVLLESANRKQQQQQQPSSFIGLSHNSKQIVTTSASTKATTSTASSRSSSGVSSSGEHLQQQHHHHHNHHKLKPLDQHKQQQQQQLQQRQCQRSDTVKSVAARQLQHDQHHNSAPFSPSASSSLASSSCSSSSSSSKTSKFACQSSADLSGHSTGGGAVAVKLNTGQGPQTASQSLGSENLSLNPRRLALLQSQQQDSASSSSSCELSASSNSHSKATKVAGGSSSSTSTATTATGSSSSRLLRLVHKILPIGTSSGAGGGAGQSSRCAKIAATGQQQQQQQQQQEVDLGQQVDFLQAPGRLVACYDKAQLQKRKLFHELNGRFSTSTRCNHQHADNATTTTTTTTCCCCRCLASEATSSVIAKNDTICDATLMNAQKVHKRLLKSSSAGTNCVGGRGGGSVRNLQSELQVAIDDSSGDNEVSSGAAANQREHDIGGAELGEQKPENSSDLSRQGSCSSHLYESLERLNESLSQNKENKSATNGEANCSLAASSSSTSSLSINNNNRFHSVGHSNQERRLRQRRSLFAQQDLMQQQQKQQQQQQQQQQQLIACGSVVAKLEKGSAKELKESSACSRSVGVQQRRQRIEEGVSSGSKRASSIERFNDHDDGLEARGGVALQTAKGADDSPKCLGTRHNRRHRGRHDRHRNLSQCSTDFNSSDDDDNENGDEEWWQGSSTSTSSSASFNSVNDDRVVSKSVTAAAAATKTNVIYKPPAVAQSSSSSSSAAVVANSVVLVQRREGKASTPPPPSWRQKLVASVGGSSGAVGRRLAKAGQSAAASKQLAATSGGASDQERVLNESHDQQWRRWRRAKTITTTTAAATAAAAEGTCCNCSDYDDSATCDDWRGECADHNQGQRCRCQQSDRLCRYEQQQWRRQQQQRRTCYQAANADMEPVSIEACDGDTVDHNGRTVGANDNDDNDDNGDKADDANANEMSQEHQERQKQEQQVFVANNCNELQRRPAHLSLSASAISSSTPSSASTSTSTSISLSVSSSSSSQLLPSLSGSSVPYSLTLSSVERQSVATASANSAPINIERQEAQQPQDNDNGGGGGGGGGGVGDGDSGGCNETIYVNLNALASGGCAPSSSSSSIASTLAVTQSNSELDKLQRSELASSSSASSNGLTSASKPASSVRGRACHLVGRMERKLAKLRNRQQQQQQQQQPQLNANDINPCKSSMMLKVKHHQVSTTTAAGELRSLGWEPADEVLLMRSLASSPVPLVSKNVCRRRTFRSTRDLDKQQQRQQHACSLQSLADDGPVSLPCNNNFANYANDNDDDEDDDDDNVDGEIVEFLQRQHQQPIGATSTTSRA